MIILSEEVAARNWWRRYEYTWKEPFYHQWRQIIQVDGMKNTLLHLAEKWNSNHMDAC